MDRQYHCNAWVFVDDYVDDGDGNDDDDCMKVFWIMVQNHFHNS